MDWPTDNIDYSNHSIAPSQLQGGFTKKKRKEPTGGYEVAHYTKNNDNDPDHGDDSDEQSVHVSKKGRAVETTAKRWKTRYEVIEQATKNLLGARKQAADPRFLEHTGTYDKKKVEKDYAFLDEMKKEEIAIMQKALKKTKNGQKKDEYRRAIQSREESMRSKERENKKEELLTQYKKAQKDQAKRGVVPTFASDKQLKKQLGVAQEFLSMSQSQIDKRIKHKVERETNRDKAQFRKQLGTPGKK